MTDKILTDRSISPSAQKSSGWTNGACVSKDLHFLPSWDRQIYRTLMNRWIYSDCSAEKGAARGQSRIWITSMLIWSQRQPERDSRAWIPTHASWIRTRTWLLMPVRRSGKVLKCTLEGSLQASTLQERESSFQSILTGMGESEWNRGWEREDFNQSRLKEKSNEYSLGAKRAQSTGISELTGARNSYIRTRDGQNRLKLYHNTFGNKI